MHKQQGYILLEYALSITLTMSITMILSHILTHELQRTIQSHSHSANMTNIYTSEYIISAYTHCKNVRISTAPPNILTIQCPETKQCFTLYTQDNHLLVKEGQRQAKRILDHITQWQPSTLPINQLEVQSTTCAYPNHCLSKKKTYQTQ